CGQGTNVPPFTF
nr:immunoglobulin light chain junction region [Macaca mulatta]